MENILLALILLVAVALAIVPTVRHFQGQGGCCGGGGYRIKKKKLKNVRYTHTFTVAGMHCNHCRDRVEEVIGDMDGLAGQVDLQKGTLTISYAKDVAEDVIAARLQRAGYTLTGRLS